MAQDLWNSHNAQMKRARYHPEREDRYMTETDKQYVVGLIAGMETTIENLINAMTATMADEMNVLRDRLAELERRTGIHEPTGE